MQQALEKTVGYERVDKIDGPGEYRFARDGNVGGYVENNSIFTEHPNVVYDYGIPKHLIETFPQMILQRFVGATLLDGEYTPAKFEFESDLKRLDGGFLLCDGEIYRIGTGGSYSNGHGSWNFSIEDIGNLGIVKNKLIIDDPKVRDGEFDLHISGSAPHHSQHRNYWQAWIDYTGEKPGKLVRTSVEYVNSEKERLDVPLWKKIG